MPLPDTAKPLLAPKARLQWDETRKKHLLLFPEGLLVLNPTAREILDLCDGERSVQEIAGKLTEKYGKETVAKDVQELLSRLADKGLLDLPSQP